MIKEYSWVPVLESDEDKDNYVPGQYETKDIYQGENCLPQFDTKEECELWCKSESPYASPKVGETKSIVNQITELENQSFEGWSDDAINGYLTACKTIKEKL
jgi:hypothetical protein